MRGLITARRFAAAIFASGCAVLLLETPALGLGYVVHRPLSFATLALAALLGELLPLTIPRRGGDEKITISTAFSFALLLVGGLGPCILAQIVAGLVQDVSVRKPWWRARFNVGQYALSLSASWIVLRLLSGAPHAGSAHPFSLAELPAVLVSATTFFVVNSGIVGTAVALYLHVPLRRYFRDDLGFIALTGGVLLCVAPIVAVTTVYSPALVALFALPMLAIHRAGGEAARSEHAARHDALTQLPNRLAFNDGASEFISDRRRSACILLMDLNRFKDINDSLGHRYGDLLLQEIGRRLQQHFGEGPVLARLGGDEFAVLLAVPDVEHALAEAQRLTEFVRSPVRLEQFVIDAEASVGVAMFPDDAEDLDTLLQKADVAMYRAKELQAGVALYDEEFDHHSAERLALTAELRVATPAEEIVVWYQPILDLGTGEVPAVEALVRWEHPERGLLGPAMFLELAEQSSLIKPLTRRVLDVALRQVASWRECGLELVVAVNVSPRVLADATFPDLVLESLRTAGVATHQLKLEVTESAIMIEPTLAQASLSRLAAAGISISIDDFGTGYSALAYLTDLPVSEVKIDRAFVTRMWDGRRDAAVVPSIIDLGHRLGLTVVAEGIEDETTLERLRELGCDLAQGYHVSRPATAERTTAWLLAAREQRRAARLAAAVPTGAAQLA